MPVFLERGGLDLKAIARVNDNKKVKIVHMREILTLMGYIHGGVSPSWYQKGLPSFYR